MLAIAYSYPVQKISYMEKKDFMNLSACLLSCRKKANQDEAQMTDDKLSVSFKQQWIQQHLVFSSEYI